MNKAIGEKAAIQFAAKFYQALAAGRSFQYAYNFACAVLNLLGSSESATPVLLNRSENSNPLTIALATAAPPNFQPLTSAQVSPPLAQQSQSVGSITISGGGTNFAVTQASWDVTLNQNNVQSSSGTHHPLVPLLSAA